MPQGLLGSGHLIKKLGKILFTHIKHTLPEITNEIKVKIKETEDDLKDLGPTMPLGDTEKMQLLWNMITDFIQTYKNTISGRYDNKRVMNTQSGRAELSGGAKIKMSFYGLYQEFENFKACDEYND